MSDGYPCPTCYGWPVWRRPDCTRCDGSGRIKSSHGDAPVTYPPKRNPEIPHD